MCRSRLARAVLASFGIVAVAALAGCGKAGAANGVAATTASLDAPVPGATATLPPGAYYSQPAANASVARVPVPAAAAAATPTRASAAPADPQVAAAVPQFARVVAVQPVTESRTSERPQRVCREEQVAVPETYRDQHQIGGAVVGGVLGALAGHLIGGGRGNTLATVAGAAGGAFAGHEIQKRHQEDNPTQMETRNVCSTVNEATTSTVTVGYNVTYSFDGRSGHLRMAHAPIVGTGLPVQGGVVVAPGTQVSGG